MSVNRSLLLLAALPGLLVVGVGLAIARWQKAIKAIPAVLLSLGVALLSVLLVVVVSYRVADAYSPGDSMLVVVGIPTVVYAFTLGLLIRRARISATMALVFGAVGLVPLYHIGGYVLVLSACSFGTGGC